AVIEIEQGDVKMMVAQGLNSVRRRADKLCLVAIPLQQQVESGDNIRLVLRDQDTGPSRESKRIDRRVRHDGILSLLAKHMFFRPLASAFLHSLIRGWQPQGSTQSYCIFAPNCHRSKPLKTLTIRLVLLFDCNPRCPLAKKQCSKTNSTGYRGAIACSTDDICSFRLGEIGDC